MSKGSDTASGALAGAGTGAAVGSFVGPWGTAIGAGVGALGGALAGYFGSSSDEEEKRARDLANIIAEIKRKQQLMPELSRNMLNRQLSARGPGNEMIGQMYGRQYMFKPEDYQKSPIPDGMFGPENPGGR